MSKKTLVTKITQKQLNGYFLAEKEWIGNNDQYNLEHFGIDKQTYSTISRALYGSFGICRPYRPTLRTVNKALEKFYQNTYCFTFEGETGLTEKEFLERLAASKKAIA